MESPRRSLVFGLRICYKGIVNAESNFSIDIFCRVVDNFGDAGVVLRLAKGLSAVNPRLDLRLIVDDLRVFQKLCPKVDISLNVQKLALWTLIRWDYPWEGFTQRPSRLIIESLGCGLPDHYGQMLRCSKNRPPAVMVNLEFLSAEPYAEEFHCVPSLTPFARVKKFFFLPGFTSGTGGLVLDPGFLRQKSYWNGGGSSSRKRRHRADSGMWGIDLPAGYEDLTWVNIFSYDQDFTGLIRGLADWEKPKLIFLAEGDFRKSFSKAWKAEGSPFPLVQLPFLPQESWDDLLLACDLSLVRGEESLSRAALSGHPFLWQAYRLDDDYQQIKVDALLERMAVHFPDPGSFSPVRGSFKLFNTRRTGTGEDTPASEETVYSSFFRRTDELSSSFRFFADALIANGDLAEHLLNFLGEIM